ncbi:hypothetical protein H634G_09360 [Metarhizium anisopliae BRIP 53293]|uniref:Uncharacterized protein n=1 Tax=Metarhizium anisopliae BRIP 53293 TaxID=1291518 RepID=A0A0D9NMN2_METAN|nr:hypothetical protein H634G_09360 [Metarhizium anisopliae BRIP 53293]KJK91757.1 hypothetical protein H633G_04373 [Metarhizium anisopliae BRIP 53284]
MERCQKECAVCLLDQIRERASTFEISGKFLHCIHDFIDISNMTTGTTPCTTTARRAKYI